MLNLSVCVRDKFLLLVVSVELHPFLCSSVCRLDGVRHLEQVADKVCGPPAVIEIYRRRLYGYKPRATHCNLKSVVSRCLSSTQGLTYQYRNGLLRRQGCHIFSTKIRHQHVRNSPHASRPRRQQVDAGN